MGRRGEDTDGATLPFLSRARPPNSRQAPALSGPYLFPALRAPLPAASANPLPSAAPRVPAPRPPAGALAFARANRRLASPAPAPIRAGWRRGFSNVIEAPPGAPRSLLFGESQAGIEHASLPGGSIPLLPSGLRLALGLYPSQPGFCNFPSSVWVSGQDRASASCRHPPGLGSLGMAGDLINWATLTFHVRFGVCFRIC